MFTRGPSEAPLWGHLEGPIGYLHLYDDIIFDSEQNFLNNRKIRFRNPLEALIIGL